MSIIELKGLKAVPDIVQEYTPSIRSSGVPLVIDNGIDGDANFVAKENSVEFLCFSSICRLVRVSRWLGI